MEAERFFDFLNERHLIYLKKLRGENYPWTDDPILHKYKFTNVFRENDKTTVWFRENVREPMRLEPEVALATIIFRWFNLINSGQILLEEDLYRNWDSKHCYEVLEKEDQWVTGAYIIKTPNGMNKLEGVCYCVDQIVNDGNKFMDSIYEARHSLHKLWEVLMPYPFMGPFMAYEVVTDWRHTWVGETAEDIMTWGNPGPGAKRGLNRVQGRPVDKNIKSIINIQEMQELLDMSPDWLHGQVPSLEMRDIEHTLCEFDKYERVRKGEGKPRSIYRYG
ncbi:MAG: hypothetical protein CL867_11365 [Cytophagaceae bacterium]|nr:hypothetical protein [Cytophagaceae bacterium]